MLLAMAFGSMGYAQDERLKPSELRQEQKYARKAAESWVKDEIDTRKKVIAQLRKVKDEKSAEKLMQSLICGTFFEISSTEVKNSMEKRAFRHHIIEEQGLHPAVSEYIRKRGLYLIGKESL